MPLSYTAPPNLVTGPSDQALFSEMQISLSCIFEGIPAPVITWMYIPFNQTMPITLSSGRKYQTSISTNREEGGVYYTATSSLEFRSENVADAGMYVCSANNGVMNLIGAITNATSLLYFEANGESTQPKSPSHSTPSLSLFCPYRSHFP